MIGGALTLSVSLLALVASALRASLSAAPMLLGIGHSPLPPPFRALLEEQPESRDDDRPKGKVGHDHEHEGAHWRPPVRGPNGVTGTLRTAARMARAVCGIARGSVMPECHSGASFETQHTPSAVCPGSLAC